MYCSSPGAQEKLGSYKLMNECGTVNESSWSQIGFLESVLMSSYAEGPPFYRPRGFLLTMKPVRTRGRKVI